MTTNKSVLITGGSGFIAPHVVRALLPSHRVILHARKPISLRTENGAELSMIASPLDFDSLNQRAKGDIDAVIHLAGAVTGPTIEDVLDSNIATTRNVLDFMRARDIPNFVLISSASVWSDSSGRRLDESIPPCPSTLYGYAKLAAERLVSDSIQRGDIRAAAILRCNNTYGPGCLQGAVASFRGRLLSNFPIQIQGDGQQLREPIYVSDLVDVIVRSLNVGNGFHLYGISGPQTLTVLDMARELAHAMGHSLRIDWKPENPERARHIVVDTGKARRELGWTPTVSYKEGVTRLCVLPFQS